jgi:hypothetical protein
MTGGARLEGHEELFGRIRAYFTPQAVDPVIDRVALETLASAVQATPKRWFGQVRAAWRIQKPHPGARNVVNDHKVMRFLEFGTANAGQGFITPKLKKALYIPLNRRAAMGWNEGLRYGVDYILRKRVRGITPRRIVAMEQVKAKARMLEAMREYIRKVARELNLKGSGVSANDLRQIGREMFYGG